MKQYLLTIHLICLDTNSLELDSTWAIEANSPEEALKAFVSLGSPFAYANEGILWEDSTVSNINAQSLDK